MNPAVDLIEFATAALYTSQRQPMRAQHPTPPSHHPNIPTSLTAATEADDGEAARARSHISFFKFYLEVFICTVRNLQDP